MGTKGDGWTRGASVEKARGVGRDVVRAKFLAIRRGTERFYPVSPLPPLSI